MKSEGTLVGFAFLIRDSAIQTSLMALAVLSARKYPNKFGISLAYS